MQLKKNTEVQDNNIIIKFVQGFEEAIRITDLGEGTEIVGHCFEAQKESRGKGIGRCFLNFFSCSFLFRYLSF